jgi:hypothetical protein
MLSSRSCAWCQANTAFTLSMTVNTQPCRLTIQFPAVRHVHHHHLQERPTEQQQLAVVVVRGVGLVQVWPGTWPPPP